MSRLEELKMKVVFNVTTWCCSPTIKCGEQLVEELIAEAQRDALEKAVEELQKLDMPSGLLNYGTPSSHPSFKLDEARRGGVKDCLIGLKALLPSEVNNESEPQCEVCKGREVFIATDVPGRAAPLMKKSVCPQCGGE